MIQMLIDSHHTLQGNEYRVFAQSSMDHDPGYSAGRPFGGMAIIVKMSHNYIVREHGQDNNRIMSITLFDLNDTPVQTMVNVYMPFYDSSLEKTEGFVEIIDAMQAVIEDVNGKCPIKFFGDFNCKLPKETPSNRNWHRVNGYNRHSSMLHDFIISNDLVAADLRHDQSVGYTFFCHQRGVYTWIDHVLCFEYDMTSFSCCNILPLSSLNDSDHLPICCSFRVEPSSAAGCHLVGSSCRKSNAEWDNPQFCEKYKAALSNKLDSMLGSLDQILHDDASVTEMDTYLAKINGAMESAVVEAGHRPRKFKPKAYWCPELSMLRNRKRFWWKIWSEAGRPRSGQVFECYKGCKKLFRKRSRHYMSSMLEDDFRRTNQLFHDGRMRRFWKRVNSRKPAPRSVLTETVLADFYADIMSDQGSLSEEQQLVASQVDMKAAAIARDHRTETVSVERVSALIDRLRSHCAPGVDSISTEHLKHGKSAHLCALIARLLSHCLSKSMVPTSFTIGIIVPIFKKPSLNPNTASSYRPVTLSSVYSKLLEMLMMPDDDHLHDSQYGFRKQRGTSLACSLLNDVMAYFKSKKSPVFVCSLDAEKCFDSLWHHALLYKLVDKMPDSHWLTLYRWYTNLKAMVRWNGASSRLFRVTRGTRQGSLLSPTIFNIFLNDLLVQLSDKTDGVSLGDVHLNSFAYADDVSLISSTVPGLQRLIDLCCNYAQRWRFRFGLKKTKCFVSGKHSFGKEPIWKIDNQVIENVDELEILGVTFSRSGSAHVDNRIIKCKKAFYGLRDSGLGYPGCASMVKSHIWKTVCQPVLSYGCDCIPLTKSGIAALNTTQSNLVKQSMGFSKRCRSSYLLHSMNIKTMSDVVSNNCASLAFRIMNVPSSAQRVFTYLLSLFICDNVLIPGSLIHRLVSCGLSPTDCAFTCAKKTLQKDDSSNGGICDSVRNLIMHVNFIKPYSEEHVLCSLMLRAF